MRRFIVAVALAALLAVCSPAQATAHHRIAVGCAHPVNAKEGLGLAKEVWSLSRWKRGAPKPAVIAAHRRQVRCAKGPGHRAAIKHRWEIQRKIYFHRRHHCRGGIVIRGRVSYFGGGLEASGHYTSEPGIALNTAPGTEWGWNNSTTRGWLASGQEFLVTIAGHHAIEPVTDLGPAGFTWRAIDVTEGGVAELGLSGAFPTDAIGIAKLIPPGCDI